MHSTSWLLRGKWLHAKKPWMGVQCFPVEARHIGGTPSVRPAYFHFKHMRAERPVRALGMNVPLLPVLYNRQDQIVQIENALALSRIENQITVTLAQLAIGIRNAEEFVDKYLINKEVRPSMHTLWFHEGGLRNQQHLLSSLSSHHLVPMFSLISHDVESGKMQTHQAIELYEELMDSTVAHAQIVQRELANQMVRVHCLNDDYEKAVEVVEEMKQRGIRRTFVTYAPMFRMIRGQDDAAQHERLHQFMYKVEGGSIAKFLYVDVPRMLYMFGVMIRHNWIAIYFTFVCCGSAAFYYWWHIRPLTLA
jgi:pentatricopeptide repeat protein